MALACRLWDGHLCCMQSRNWLHRFWAAAVAEQASWLGCIGSAETLLQCCTGVCYKHNGFAGLLAL